jgi:septum formation inhibitor MinC
MIAHQCQMSQLKDNFKEKLKSSEDWPNKLNIELEKEQQKHKKQLNDIEKNLLDNFRIVRVDSTVLKSQFLVLFLFSKGNRNTKTKI